MVPGPKVACADGSCAFGFCRNPCNEDSDCANSGVCLSDGQTKGCRLPSEAKCSASDPCPAGLSCADDGSCRTPCDDDRPCDVEDQVCVEGACVGDAPVSTGGTGGSGSGGKGGTASTGGKGGAASGGMSGSGGSGNAGGAEGGETSMGGEGGAPIVPATCGELGQDCCESGSACSSAHGLSCGAGEKCACDLGQKDCANGAADGCESAPSADPDNCGDCGHACGGGDCVAGICQAEIVVPGGPNAGEAESPTWAPGGGYPRTFNLFDANGYVLPSKNPANGMYRLQAFSKDGTPGAVLATPVELSMGPWITSSGVFWVQYNSEKVLRRVARGGGAVTSPVSATTGLYVKVDGDNLYYQDDTTLYKIPGGSLTPATVYSGMGLAYAVSGSEVFTYNGSYELMRGKAGAPLALEWSAFQPPQCSPAGLIADGASVFAYGACSDQPEGYIVRYDYTDALQGGTRQVILKDIPAIKEITHAALVGSWVYFVDNGGPYKLYRVARSGGTPELLLSNGPFYGLGHDAEFFYTWGGAPGPDGLARIRIPL